MYKKLLAMSMMVLSTGAHAQNLPKYNINPQEVSLTGLSSGGYMAVQYHAVYSSTVKGIAVIAAGPYHCSGDTPQLTDIVNCVSAAPDSAASLAKLKANAAAGVIDPVEKMADARVYLFHGVKDPLVKRSVVDSLNTYYQALAGNDKIKYVNTMEAGHAFITDNPAHEACAEAMSTYYVSNCKHDQAGEILQWINNGKLKDRNSGELGGQIVAFDQSEFTGGLPLSFEKTGYAYVPADCAAGEACKLHIVFHGCGQGAEAVKDVVYGNNGTGHNRWADTNRMVVLYPQVNKSNSIPYNPFGCWDWWGYAGPGWDTNKGQQMKAVKAMVDRLTAGRR